MAMLVCPNCGNEIELKFFTPKTIKCSKCKNAFTAEYEDADGNLHPGGWEGFEVVHPKAAKAVKICGETVLGAVIVYGFTRFVSDKFDELTASAETSSTPDTSSATVSQNCETSVESSSSETSDDSETKNISVKGGIVNLPAGWHASQEKRDEAEANGYSNLGENQTWKVNYSRNIKVTSGDDD